MSHITPLFGLLAILCCQAIAEPTHSGRARVEWVSKTTGYTPGEPVVTALKMTLDKGWHTYWINPGEAGMPLSASFSLPEGWRADSPDHPLPIRFTTGGLSDFGYEGTVLFPITLYPPSSANGVVKIEGTFSWLACNDSACVPGDATLSLVLNSGDRTPTPAAVEIAKTLQHVPIKAPDGWKLDVTVIGGDLDLRLTMPPSIQPGDIDVFPLTANIAHPAAVYTWSARDDAWHARVTKSSYAPDTIDHLELVVHAPSLDRPVIVRGPAE